MDYKFISFIEKNNKRIGATLQASDGSIVQLGYNELKQKIASEEIHVDGLVLKGNGLTIGVSSNKNLPTTYREIEYLQRIYQDMQQVKTELGLASINKKLSIIHDKIDNDYGKSALNYRLDLIDRKLDVLAQAQIITGQAITEHYDSIMDRLDRENIMVQDYIHDVTEKLDFIYEDVQTRRQYKFPHSETNPKLRYAMSDNTELLKNEENFNNAFGKEKIWTFDEDDDPVLRSDKSLFLTPPRVPLTYNKDIIDALITHLKLINNERIDFMQSISNTLSGVVPDDFNSYKDSNILFDQLFNSMIQSEKSNSPMNMLVPYTLLGRTKLPLESLFNITSDKSDNRRVLNNSDEVSVDNEYYTYVKMDKTVLESNPTLYYAYVSDLRYFLLRCKGLGVKKFNSSFEKQPKNVFHSSYYDCVKGTFSECIEPCRDDRFFNFYIHYYFKYRMNNSNDTYANTSGGIGSRKIYMDLITNAYFAAKKICYADIVEYGFEDTLDDCKSFTFMKASPAYRYFCYFIKYALIIQGMNASMAEDVLQKFDTLMSTD